MTTDQIEAERVRFEAWANKQFTLMHHLLPRMGEGYFMSRTDSAWDAWLARAEEQYAERKGE